MVGVATWDDCRVEARQVIKDLGWVTLIETSSVESKVIDRPHCSFVVVSARRIDPSLSYFSFQQVLHDWYNKGRCSSILWDGEYKRTFAANRKRSLCSGGSGLPLSLLSGP